MSTATANKVRPTHRIYNVMKSAGTDDVLTMTLPSGNTLGYFWDTNAHSRWIGRVFAAAVGTMLSSRPILLRAACSLVFRLHRLPWPTA